MQVSILDPIPVQPSAIEIIKLDFAFERSKMEQKYLRLQKTADKVESNARVHKRKAQRMTNVYTKAQVHKRKAQRMTDVYTKAKNENENLYIANKKLCGQVKDTRIRCFFGTQQREREASLRKSNH